MRNRKFLYISIIIPVIILAVIAGCSSFSNNNHELPVAQEGKMDVTKWNFEEQGNIRLDGQWEFYSDKLVEPHQFEAITNNKALLQVPKTWNDQKLGSRELDGQGFGTYRLLIKFNESDLHTEKALFILNTYTANKVWIDGKLVDEKGKVGTSKDNSDPHFEYETIEFTPSFSTTEIVIQVSNFDHDKGGLTNNILLGNEHSIDQYLDLRQGFEGFVIGGLALMGMYHLALYTTRREDPTSLFFGLSSLVFFLYEFFGSTYEIIFDYFMDWSTVLRIDYLIVYFIPPIFLLYVRSLYPKETSKIAVWLAFLMLFFYGGVTVTTSTVTFTKFMPSYNFVLLAFIVYLLYVFIMALIRKRMGATLILIMFFIFVLASISDMFYYFNHYLFEMKIASLGFLFFLGAHSFVLSLRYARAFRDVEDLTKEIEITQKEIIYTLGEIVEVRSNETGNHVKRVAEYSQLLASKCGLSKKEIELIKLASPMHDIGKVGIPDSILNKPGKLTLQEFEIIKTHTSLGYEMIKHSHREILQCAAEIALTHHEKWNGKGYPNGLMGEEIPITGRITAVADVFDALGSNRVYKDAWDLEDILDYFQSERGGHFDPRMVDILFENLDQFLLIKERYSDPPRQHDKPNIS
ncbi:HD-GYP domain-containing protein [Bacillus massilinigeriensis]|uniref:HD-GYP domain-containing protein n=1 Tax=Bacillus massilionigeriensis TaxID=1805475 RepID=UPI00096AED51|nr:HD domain-containing phosphohydrolase [Bacillus massilionigeriensis]